MRDVTVAAILYMILFVVLTTKITMPMGSLSVETLHDLHYLFSELVFWAGTLYICASGTYGAFVRQDKFGMSRDYPLMNRALSMFLLVSPFLAVFINVRFTYLLLGLLLLSHARSKTDEDRTIEFTKTRMFSNSVLIILFTLALMLMNANDYYVTSMLNFGSVNDEIEGVNVTR